MEKLIRASGQTVLNVCGCGRLHLTYGPITLHFEAIEFSLFANDVAQIAGHLKRFQDHATRDTPASPLGTGCH